MNKETDIQKLLQKFVENNCNENEIETIIAYVKKAKGSEDFPNFDEVLQQFEELPDMEQNKAQEMYHNILKSAKRHKSAVKARKIWRYSAAAILVIALGSTYFLKDSIFNANKPIENTTPIIVNNQIETGIDKATLILEDGSIVILEKGSNYQAKNVTSNGEEIIYENLATAEITYNYLTIPRGGQFQITLADGTKVWLNSETQLKYPVAFIEGKTRQVELVYGEAYFEVSPSTAHKGATFKVYNKAQEIEVLGTEFNIKAYKDEVNIYTTLVEGKVAVNYKGNHKNLIPGQQLNLNATTNKHSVYEVDVKSQIAWKEGIFDFDGMQLKEIMKVLSRWYDFEVIFENKSLETVKFKGILSKNQSIEEILSAIRSTSLNNYEINGKRIVLR
jgi:hypothetical protein